MNSTNAIIGIIVLVLIGAGAYYFSPASDSGEAMMHDEGTMVEQGDAMMHDASSTDTMMSDTAMSSSTGDAMMYQ